MRRSALILFALLTGFVVAAPPAAAVPPGTETQLLGQLWTTTLEAPLPENPLAGGDPCVQLAGHVVAPFSAFLPTLTCTVKPGTRLLIAGVTVECSTAEGPPFSGTDPASLRACAIADSRVASLAVTVDGARLSLLSVVTGPLAVTLSAPNIVAGPAGPATSVAAGQLALTQPLPVGCHEIAIEGTFAPDNPAVRAGAVQASFSNSTTIAVSPPGRPVTCG
jgi:hypothetical protein